MRVQRFLALSGHGSRREAEVWIEEGLVKVNGKTAELGQTIDPEADTVTLEGRRVKPPGERIYLAMHKPREVMTTRTDPKGRRTVMEFVPRDSGLVMPVGRLDYHSSGLLLLTNDGDLAQRLTRPDGEVPKVYHVKAGRPFEENEGDVFRRGITIEGRRTRPARLRRLEGRPGPWYEVVLTEGRNRQIRKMFEALGNRVQKLQRVAIGPIELGKLQPGQTRPLTEPEVERLKRAAGLAPEREKPKRRKPGWALPKGRRVRPGATPKPPAGRTRKPAERAGRKKDR